MHGLVGQSVGRSVGCVGGSGEGAQSRATLGGDGNEGTCKVGATVAACAGDLGARHDGGSSDGGGGQLGGRARGHHSRYGRGLDPPVPCSGVNVEDSRSAGPRPDALLHLLPALREVVFSGTLDVCRAFFSDAKVDAVGEAAPANTTSLRGGRAGGDVDPVETPDLVTEDDPRGQASHPPDGLLPGAGGNLPRRDSARNGRESREGLGGSAGAPVGRRSMGDLARLIGSTASCHATQAPSDSTQAATAPEGEGRALAGSAATSAGACGSAPVGGTFLRQRPRRTRGPQRRHRGSVQCTAPRRGKATE